MTREHVVFPIMPLVADEKRLRAGDQYYQYDPDLPTKWGIMPRGGTVRRHALVRHPRHRAGPHHERLYRWRQSHRRHARVSPGNCFCFFRDKHGNLPSMAETVTQLTRITFDLSKDGATR